MFDKEVHIWIGSYLQERWNRIWKPPLGGLVHILFCLADHFEPMWGKPGYEIECARVDRWCREYPPTVDQFQDSHGRRPQHTFFYPAEEYRPEHLDKLADLVHRGYGEVEIHLHHDGDNSAVLREKLESFKQTLFEKHGLLCTDSKTGEIRYGFIHGNWALDNSRRDGKWCGVNDEITVLKETGCYADFTLPSAPSDTQTRKINSIYYAVDDPQKPKSHNDGIDAVVHGENHGDLLIVQGPLTLNWKRRSRGVFPRIENGEIDADNPPTPDRIDLWIQQRIHVRGRPEWVFVKVYTHGANERNTDMLLGDSLRSMHRVLQEQYNDGKRYQLHFVTARELYNLIKAAEDGISGDPSSWMDYSLTKGGRGETRQRAVQPSV